MIAKGRSRRNGADAETSFRLGALQPLRVVQPRNANELAAALRTAGDAGQAAVIFGGGTLQRASNPPSRYDVAIGTGALDAVHDYDPRDLTIGAGGGMTVAALQQTLAQHRQFLPLDAPFASRATLGGTLASGWAGPRRAVYGRPRDLLIGITVALADGTLASSGGMVVKNVTGYDMGKLYVGSHGTLGAIVRANFKVLPMPAVRRLAMAPFEEELGPRMLAHVAGLTLEPVALTIVDGFAEAPCHPELVEGRAQPRLIALFEGSAELVERSTRELRSALGAAGIAETRLVDDEEGARAFQRLLDAYATSNGETSVTLVARGLPSDAASRAQRVRKANRDAETIADLRTGDVIARVRDRAEMVRDLFGHATVVCSGPAATIDAWGSAPTTLETMRALKARFDPNGTLAPGRFVGGL